MTHREFEPDRATPAGTVGTAAGRAGLVERLRSQARACELLGSPMYARLLRETADDAAAGGTVAGILAGHENDSEGSALPLRLLGAVHRLVLDGRAPDLARYYPSAGGTADPARAWPAFRGLLRRHGETIRALLPETVQTNEPGRACALIGGLLWLAAGNGLPIRLLEIGTSAGLNLRADNFHYVPAGGAPGRGPERGYGPPASPVRLPNAWTTGGTWPDRDAPLSIVARRGCDPVPVDPTTEEGRLRLLSYVWPDQPDRIARLRGAIEIAHRVPADVVRASAAEFLSGLRPRAGVTTVVWHSVMWQYLPPRERAGVRAALERAGAAATEGAPLAQLGFEPRRGQGATFVLAARTWPGGREEVLGTAPPHGCPVDWR